MRMTIGTFLANQGVKIEQTVYREEEADTLSYPIMAGNFWRWDKQGDAWREFAVTEMYEKILADEKKNREYLENTENIQICGDILAGFRQQTDAHTYRDVIKEVRKRKKELEEQKKVLDESCQIKAARTCFQMETPLSGKVIIYKDMLYLTSYRQLTCFLEKIPLTKLPEIENTPFLCTSLFCLQAARQRAKGENQPLGMEGGPCLFGHDEVIMEVIHDTGEHFYFDYSDPKNYEMNNSQKGDEEGFAAHVAAYGSQIVRISFRQKKKNLTIDEFKSLLYVFVFADALRAKAIIPIPDMSYRKYLSAVCRGIRPEVAVKAQEEFKELIFGITDQYLDCIAGLQKRYPQLPVEVLHERNEDLCRRFYEARKVYLDSASALRNLTAHPCKQEAVLDYITMPALPFYLWGLKEVIQIDCLSEADSFRKCRKLHGKSFHLHGIFYPEKVCRDGEHTMFSAQNSWKEYIDR